MKEKLAVVIREWLTESHSLATSIITDEQVAGLADKILAKDTFAEPAQPAGVAS